jgi:hypothetical protein
MTRTRKPRKPIDELQVLSRDQLEQVTGAQGEGGGSGRSDAGGGSSSGGGDTSSYLPDVQLDGYGGYGGGRGGRRGEAGGGTGKRVICTHFYRKGEMSRALWAADMRWTLDNLSPTTIRGYHFWAISYVRLMRRSRLAERIMRPIALARAEEIAFKVGARDRGNLLGKLVRLVLEPASFLLGTVVGQRDWAALYTPAEARALAE